MVNRWTSIALIMKKIILFIAPLLIYVACSNSNSGSNNAGVVAVEDRSNNPNFKDTLFDKSFQTYLNLKDAFILDNNEGAAEIAIFLATQLFKCNLAKEAELAIKISQTKDLAVQRDLFTLLSSSFVQAVQKENLQKGKVYIEFCSMANNGKGAYWVSTEKQIRNPYFGNDMLKCGEIKEEIITK